MHVRGRDVHESFVAGVGDVLSETQNTVHRSVNDYSQSSLPEYSQCPECSRIISDTCQLSRHVTYHIRNGQAMGCPYQGCLDKSVSYCNTMKSLLFCKHRNETLANLKPLWLSRSAVCEPSNTVDANTEGTTAVYCNAGVDIQSNKSVERSNFMKDLTKGFAQLALKL